MRWRQLLFSLLILVYYNAGAEWMRAEKGRLHSADDLISRAPVLLWPPWRALQLHVSHDGDDHLYFEFTHMILGEPADLEYVAQKCMRDLASTVASAPRPGPLTGGVRELLGRLNLGYPPFGLVMMLAPRLVAKTLPAYRITFGAMMSMFYLLSIALALRLARRCAMDLDVDVWLRRGTWLLLAIGPILVQRFDMLPALLTLGIVVALVERRPVLASLLIVLGVAAKMYPLLLLPTWTGLLLGFGGPAARTMRLVLALLGGLAALGALFLIFAAGGAVPILTDVAAFRARPFQVESLVGSLLLAGNGASAIFGSFGSHNVTSSLAQRIAGPWDAVMAGAVIAVAVAAWRWSSTRRQASAAQQGLALCYFTSAALLVLLCTSKVLSAQYMIWCVPLLAMLPGRPGLALYRLLLLALVLTQIEFPVAYALLLAGSPPVVAALVLRNLILCLMAGLCLRGAWGIASRDAAHGTP